MKSNKIKIFYDGGCRVCDSEISHYKNIDQNSEFEYIDINNSKFDPQQYDRTLDDFMQQLHVMDATGKFKVGVDAFRLLWRRLPGPHYYLLEILTGLPGINLLSRIGYGLFAANRHRISRKDG